MAEKTNVDGLIREAFAGEGMEGFEKLCEPGLQEMVTEVFRGRMRAYGAVFLAMILGCAVLAVFCAVQFLSTDDVPQMLRWGAGLFLCFLAVQGGRAGTGCSWRDSR